MDERAIISGLRKKTAEIQSLEEKLRTARIYVQALQDVMKAIGGAQPEEGRSESILRSGSAVSQARDVILGSGKPVHVSELLTALGREDTRDVRASLTSQLAAYVRRGEVFTRPAPNTYGLVELGHESAEEPEQSPPQGFGGVPADLDDEIPF